MKCTIRSRFSEKQLQAIAARLRIPKHLLGKGSSSNYASAVMAERSFLRHFHKLSEAP